VRAGWHLYAQLSIQIMTGRAFELLVVRRLKNLLGPTLSLSLTGGSYDGGIDALGTWCVQLQQSGTANVALRRLALAVQCKQLKRAVGPSVVREFEGAVRNWKRELEEHSVNKTGLAGVLGLLCVQPRFTEAAIAVAGRNELPLVLVVLERPPEQHPEHHEDREACIVEFRLNRAARYLLPHMTVSTKKIPCESPLGSPLFFEQISLCYE